jgi:predicted nucleic acid-binding protein
MSAVDFIDTNVLVYLFDRTDDRKREIAHRLVSAAQAGHGVISFQVVQETLAIVTTKFKPRMTLEDSKATLDSLLRPLWIVQPSAALYIEALAVKDRFGFSFYDSLIVASALEAGCKRLLTEDLQHGQRIGGLRVENPFLK